jgi:plastocyanin
MTHWKSLVVVAVLCAMLALIGCTGSATSTTPATPAATGGASATVIEKGFAFDPPTLEVKVGDTVTFTNQDSATHNVSIDNAELGPQAQGASVTWKATKAGTFPYMCTIHPSMTGTIAVK